MTTRAAPQAQPPGLTLALAGNPNSGKTTVFNYYTGARQHVANYPGITVERKEGRLDFEGRRLRLLDLPGTYSLTAYSQDELVARRGLIEDKPDCVLDIINASSLERNLYLAVQMLEMGLPLALVLNMHDEAEKQGLRIDAKRLSALLKTPVTPTVARQGKGLHEALRAAVRKAEECREQKPEPLLISYGPDLDPVIEDMTRLLEQEENMPPNLGPARWAAVKYLENDAELRAGIRAVSPALAALLDEKTKAATAHLRQTLNSYPEALIADYRYGFIHALLRRGVLLRAPTPESRLLFSDQMDRLLTHRLLGPLLMVGIIYLMYKVTFTLGAIPLDMLEELFSGLGAAVSGLMPDGILKSLLVSGLIDGVGAVLGFVPLILLMFLQISILEDSGYMARVAYMMDRAFRSFGLHGYSVMPFIIAGGIAGGCGVPGVLATRTLRSPRERLATLLTVPMMTCGAKLPVFMLLASAFFPGDETMVMMLIWLFAWVSALGSAKFLRSTVLKGASTPFVMELPPYRPPTLFGVLIHTWERVWEYIKRAGTIIVAVSILIWLGMSFPALPEDLEAAYAGREAGLEQALAQAGEEEKEDLRAALGEARAAHGAAALEHSLAGQAGRALEGISSLAGFDWRANIALVGGIGAKEVIVSTLGTAYSLGEVDPDASSTLQARIAADPRWNKANAAALMVFVLLYFPCFVTVTVIKQEAGSWKWALAGALFNTAYAFAAAILTYRAGLALL